MKMKKVLVIICTLALGAPALQAMSPRKAAQTKKAHEQKINQFIAQIKGLDQTRAGNLNTLSRLERDANTAINRLVSPALQEKYQRKLRTVAQAKRSMLRQAGPALPTRQQIVQERAAMQERAERFAVAQEAAQEAAERTLRKMQVMAPGEAKEIRDVIDLVKLFLNSISQQAKEATKYIQNTAHDKVFDWGITGFWSRNLQQMLDAGKLEQNQAAVTTMTQNVNSRLTPIKTLLDGLNDLFPNYVQSKRDLVSLDAKKAQKALKGLGDSIVDSFINPLLREGSTVRGPQYARIFRSMVNSLQDKARQVGLTFKVEGGLKF